MMYGEEVVEFRYSTELSPEIQQFHRELMEMIYNKRPWPYRVIEPARSP